MIVLSANTILNTSKIEFDILLSTFGGLQYSVQFLLACLLVAGVVVIYLKNRPRSIYLMDFACYLPSSTCRVPKSTFIENFKLMELFDDCSIQFFERLLQSRSGIGEETCVPQSLLNIPPSCSLYEARADAELVIFAVIDDLLSKTGINPNAIDILVVNCSNYSPVPSLSDMILNRYKLRNDIHSVNLSGMACSAGLISVGLAKDLLRAAAHGAHALVVSTEILTLDLYKGKERGMQVPNLVFRVGGAAVLLSTSKHTARFRLAHLVRTTTGADDSSYQSIFQEEDGDGILGANISQNLLTVAGNALKTNFTAIGHLVLPLSAKLLYALSSIMSKYFSSGRAKEYQPDIGTVFEHLCIHPGGQPVIDKVQQSLGLSDLQMEPSRMTLHRFGNTSSSSVWYELAYIEAKSRMHRDDRVWMVGFGAGFECSSTIWECIRPAGEVDKAWAGCIDKYPMDTSRGRSGDGAPAPATEYDLRRLY
jgi:3-ketoacyl-CoA synthase